MGRLRKKNYKKIIEKSKHSKKEILTDIPLKFEISIRCNLALILCRICDYEEALRHCYIMQDLYKQEFVSSNQQKCARYDAYIDFIEMKVAHNQKYSHQSIEKAKKIIIHQ